MSGYQFFHVETYARIPSKNHKKQSSRGVAREAERVPEACLHVDSPQPYKLMFGCSPSEAVDLAEERAEQGKDKLGRKLRKDAQILLAGVASYPVPIAELNPKDEELNKWLKLNYEFLKRKYSNKIKSIVAHTDERFFHIHFYIIPDLDDEGRMNIGQVHDGILARDLVGGKQAKKKMRAYKDAMRALQDEYFEYVGKFCGLTRQGANKRRLTRSAWKVEQATAERLAYSLEMVDEIEEKAVSVEIEHKELLKAKEKLSERENNLVTLKEKTDKQLKKVKTENKNLINLKAEKNNVVRYLIEKVEGMKEQLSKLLNGISHLKNENINLKKEVNDLAIKERTLVRVNEKLTYQNELRAKALQQDRSEMLDLVTLASTGRTEEIKEKYNNNNKEYAL